MEEKRCTKCGEVKALREFPKHATCAGGHRPDCKKCCALYNKVYYQEHRASHDTYTKRWQKNNRERVYGYHKKYISVLENRQKNQEVRNRYRKNNPSKAKAHNAVMNAIHTGQLVREPCEICGKEKSQAHHTDYSKPLEVRWLCFKHHKEIHGQTVTKE